ncbi:MAG: arsenate reductase family protein [Oscillospiraceae bacterium]
MTILCYPKCSTCKKAVQWLENNNINFTYRDIALNNPTSAELKSWHKLSTFELKKFFNSSGLKYKELDLKDKIQSMPEEEQYNLLATDGMLVKRPIIVGEDFILIGFKEDIWAEKFGISK